MSTFALRAQTVKRNLSPLEHCLQAVEEQTSSRSLVYAGCFLILSVAVAPVITDLQSTDPYVQSYRMSSSRNGRTTKSTDRMGTLEGWRTRS